MQKRWFVMAVLLAVPFLLWTLVKPIRVIAPEWVTGLSCPTAHLCLDDPSHLAEASRLYSQALDDVAKQLGAFEDAPRVIFCASQACFRSFGFKRAAGVTVGDFAIVISPRGWELHFLRHEMIHYLQAERLGVLSQWFSPPWFKEGMAYALSDDPRPSLEEPWQQYREAFLAWYREVGRERLWREAERL